MTGKELRDLRLALKLSQRQLAQILGVTRVTITRAERDKPSRMVQSFIDRALRAGELRLPDEKSGKKRS